MTELLLTILLERQVLWMVRRRHGRYFLHNKEKGDT